MYISLSFIFQLVSILKFYFAVTKCYEHNAYYHQTPIMLEIWVARRLWKWPLTRKHETC